MAVDNINTMNLNSAGEAATFQLIIPFLNPGIGAHGGEDLLEVVAGFVVGATLLLAAMEIHIGLVAVAGHVLVGETWIEGSGFQFSSHVCIAFFRHEK